MLLTKKLLGYLSRVFNKDPQPFLALRLSHADPTMAWQVQDAVLTTTVGGVPDLTVDLSLYTLGGLAGFLAGSSGYAVLLLDQDRQRLSARVLLDGSASIGASNGDHLYAHDSALWAFMEPIAFELTDAASRLEQMLLQMSTRTASDAWLDEQGSYYGVPRLDGETDASYGPRIITEVLRPQQNNVAIEMAIKAYTGQSAAVTDVVQWTPAHPAYDSSATYNAAIQHNAAADPLYGLFDVVYGYDLINGGDFSGFSTVVRGVVDRLRAAGTHMRALSLSGSSISDNFTPPTDSAVWTVGAAMTDSAAAPSESTTMGVALSALSDSADAPDDTGGMAMTVTYGYLYDARRSYSGSFVHTGGTTASETL